MQQKEKKKLSISEIENSVQRGHATEQSGLDNKSSKTAVKFNKRGKKKIKHLKLYIVLGILAVIVAGFGYFGWTLYGSLSKAFAGGQAPNLLSMFSGTQLKGESSGRVNILLMGIGDDGHAGQYLSDTIMIISYDVKTKQAAMISVPRDMYVKIDSYGSAKINAADAYGEYYKYPGGGPALAEKTISQVLGIPIHYYARVDFTGLKDIVNAVGGVDINVTQDLYDPFYPSDDGLHGALYIKKGQQHMDGTMALRYSRSRETTSDFDRARRQQQVLVAVKEKVMSSNTLLNPVQIEQIAAAVGSHLKTDFSVNEIPRAIDLFKGVDTSKIRHLGFDNSEKGLLTDNTDSAAGYILIPRAGLYNYSALQAAVANIFNSSSSVQSEAATVTVLNGTSTAGLGSRAAETLRSAGYNVTTVATADSSDYSQTSIIDYSGGAKPNTIAGIKQTLKVGSSTTATNSAYGTDITVIIGADYK